MSNATHSKTQKYSYRPKTRLTDTVHNAYSRDSLRGYGGTRRDH